MSGSRPDMLVLAASSKVLHRRMIDPDFLENAALKSAQVLMVAAAIFADGCADLSIAGPRMRKVFPSTGFLGICYVLANFPASEWDIKLCGSNWQGWKRHDWQNERAWGRGDDCEMAYRLGCLKRAMQAGRKRWHICASRYC